MYKKQTKVNLIISVLSVVGMFFCGGPGFLFSLIGLIKSRKLIKNFMMYDFANKRYLHINEILLIFNAFICVLSLILFFSYLIYKIY